MQKAHEKALSTGMAVLDIQVIKTSFNGDDMDPSIANFHLAAKLNFCCVHIFKSLRILSTL